MDAVKLKDEYDARLNDFTRLEKAIKATFEDLIQSDEIPFLAVTGRIKEFNSFRDKVENKGYKNPFDENEDFIGIRIITYFLSNILDIERIIESEKFKVVSSSNKEEELGEKEFGYRSVHYILKIPSSWAKTPNFRGLAKIKFEVQLRTVLMHAWAEVEHKLQYKGGQSTPSKVKRKFGRIAAKLEESDEQFEEILDSVNSYVEQVESAISDPKRYSSIEIDTETLRVFGKERMLEYVGYYQSTTQEYYSQLAKELGEHGYRYISELDKDMNYAAPAFINFLARSVVKPYYTDVGWIRLSLRGIGKLEGNNPFLEEDLKLII